MPKVDMLRRQIPETPPVALEVQAITTESQLFELASRDQTKPIPEATQARLHNLWDRAHEAGKKIFVVEANQMRFTVVAESADEINQNKNIIADFLFFQSHLVPENIWGKCLYVHELAALLGYTDGNASAVSRQVDASRAVYRIGGLHDVGWKKVRGKVIWVDFTAQPHIFSEKKSDQPVFNGLVVIQAEVPNLAKRGMPTGTVETPMEHLYQCHWLQEPPSQDDGFKSDLIEMARTEILKPR